MWQASTQGSESSCHGWRLAERRGRYETRLWISELSQREGKTCECKWLILSLSALVAEKRKSRGFWALERRVEGRGETAGNPCMPCPPPSLSSTLLLSHFCVLVPPACRELSEASQAGKKASWMPGLPSCGSVGILFACQAGEDGGSRILHSY